ncbi:MAG: ABC transporter ATP-binding protein [Anaerolineae bacterium]
MSEIAIETRHLTRRFGRVLAVDDLNLAVETGQVYGFLGPNGAGKTTTIRMLLNLVRPTHGEVFIYGQPVARNHGVLKRVGAQVEDATFYAFLSGRRNLEVLARISGVDVDGRIDALLAQAGLAERARDRVGTYSTGMRQRLGLAATLLTDPDLLLLDEPTSGMDPAGMASVRDFIKSLPAQGKTVFLSSHLLSEVEQVCDRVAIINRGRVVAEGPVSALLEQGGRSSLLVEAAPVEAARAALAAWSPVDAAERPGWLYLAGAADDAPAVTQRLVEAGVAVHQVVRQRQTLEAFFLSVTGEGVVVEGAGGDAPGA